MYHPCANNCCGAVADFNGQIGIGRTEVAKAVSRPDRPVETELPDTGHPCNLWLCIGRLATDSDVCRQRKIRQALAFKIQILVTGSCISAGIGCHPFSENIGTHTRQTVDGCSAGDLTPGIYIRQGAVVAVVNNIRVCLGNSECSIQIGRRVGGNRTVQKNILTGQNRFDVIPDGDISRTGVAGNQVAHPVLKGLVDVCTRSHEVARGGCPDAIYLYLYLQVSVRTVITLQNIIRHNFGLTVLIQRYLQQVVANECTLRCDSTGGGGKQRENDSETEKVTSQMCKGCNHQLMVFIRQNARKAGSHAENSEKREACATDTTAAIRRFCHKNRALRSGKRR